MLPSWANDRVTVWRAPMVDIRGTQERLWAAAEPHDVTGCSVQPGTTGTDWDDARQTATVRAVVFMPPASDVEAGDLVEFDGTKYAIDGGPKAWRSPTGAASHIECALIDWEG